LILIGGDSDDVESSSGVSLACATSAFCVQMFEYTNSIYVDMMQYIRYIMHHT